MSSFRRSLVTSVLAAVPLLFGFAANATSIAIGQQITNGGFTTNLSGWTTSGTANWRSGTDAIDTATGNQGFNNFFSSGFVALGDLSGDIRLQPWDSTHYIEQSFTLASAIAGQLIDSYSLDVSFRAVFEGRDDPTGTGSLNDVFSVLLVTPTGVITLASANSSTFPDTFGTTSSFNSQIMWNPYSGQISGLAPGSYTLRFVLNEAFEPNETWFTNTAAGIDGVEVTGTAYVPEPGSLALLGLGLVGLGLSRRRKAA